MSSSTESNEEVNVAGANAAGDAAAAEAAAPHPTSDMMSDRQDCGEAPAVEGLLLLQHVAESKSSVSLPMKRQVTPRDGQEGAETPVDELECATTTTVTTATVPATNPIHDMLRKGGGLLIKRPLDFYRGVFAHSKPSVYYSIIRTVDRYHFLGFYDSAQAAAQAWDLAALKRTMDTAENLSNARTNFRLEDYVQMENVLSMMVVLSFGELAEMFRDVNKDLGDCEDCKEVQKRMDACSKAGFVDELGNVPVPSKMHEDVPHGSFEATKSFTPEAMHDLISSSCGHAAPQNSWVRNIRDNKKWKGVYFSRDGVPYSKVEFGGKYHYLGRFDTLEDAARAYDLATLKRAMMNNLSLVPLNFSIENYIKDKQLMEFLYTADSDQVSSFIRMMALNQRASTGDHYGRGRPASKRQKLDTSAPMTGPDSWGRKPAPSAMQRVDWDALNLGKQKTSTRVPLPLPLQQSPEEREPFLDAEEDATDASKRQEMQVERRICDANMTALLRDSKDWVRVALNAVALKITPANILVSTNQAILPGDVAEWFGAFTSNVEGPHAVELTNACGKQSFHFICYVAMDHCRISATAWNQFVDEIGLTVGDILVLLKSNSLWKLSYAVFVLPDVIMGESCQHNHPRGHCPTPRMPSSLYIPSQPAIRPTPSTGYSAKRTLQAQVLTNAQYLSGIHVLQRTRDGRLLVEAGLTRDPVTGLPSDPMKRQLFVIPANSVQATPMIRPPAGLVRSGHQIPPTPVNKRCAYVQPPGVTLNQSKIHSFSRPACLPSGPIRMNIRSGFKAMAKKNEANIIMVTDSNGQMRLITSQAPCQHSFGRPAAGVQPVNYAPSPEGEPVMAYPSPYFSQSSQQQQQRNVRPSVDRISRTSPEITVIDPSTTGSDASGTGMEKPMAPDHQEEHSSGKQVIDLVGEDEKEATGTTTAPPATSASTSIVEKQGDNLPDMYGHIVKILEDCEGLHSDVIKQYKFAFVNKMSQGQQAANFMEIKNLSQAGEWEEVAEWIKRTVESFK